MLFMDAMLTFGWEKKFCLQLSRNRFPDIVTYVQLSAEKYYFK